MSKMTTQRLDDQDQLQCKLSYGDVCGVNPHEGIALAYFVCSTDQDYEIRQCEYRLDCHPEPNYQVRAYRQDQRLRGRRVRELPKSALRSEIVLIPGAGMAPEEVITALEKVIKAIRQDGLHVGKTKKDTYCLERIGKAPRYISAEAMPLGLAIEKT